MTNRLSERFTKEYIKQIGMKSDKTEVKSKNGFTFADAIKANRRDKDD
jgi:hypothetical protein